MQITEKDINRRLLENIKDIKSVDSEEKRNSLAKNCDIFTSLCLLAQSYYTALEVENEELKNKYKSLVKFIIPFSSLWEDQEGKLGSHGADLERLNPAIDIIDDYLLSLGNKLGMGKEEYKFLLITSALNHYYKKQANQLHLIAVAIVDEKEKNHLSAIVGNRKKRKQREKEVKDFFKRDRSRMVNVKNNRLAMFDRNAKLMDNNLVIWIENNVDFSNYRVD